MMVFISNPIHLYDDLLCSMSCQPKAMTKLLSIFMNLIDVYVKVMGLNESEVVTGRGVKTCQHTSAFHICEVAIFQEGNFLQGTRAFDWSSLKPDALRFEVS